MKKLFLFICLFATTMLAKAVDFEYDGVTYTILSETDKTVSTKAGSYSAPGHQNLRGELKLHETVEYNGEQYTLTEIGNYSFYNCSNLTGSLIIPESVTSIGSFAFRDCSGFTGSLTIPNSVTAIGQSAFGRCTGFTGSLTIPNAVTSIGSYAFSECSGFTGTLTIPDAVTFIGTGAFSSCTGFTGSLTIPNAVTSIGSYAFQGCSGFTGSLTIGNAVPTIGKEAFRDCSGFTGSLTIGNAVTSIDDRAFQGCSGFTGSLTIPNSVTFIGNYAFYGCSGFTGSLTIGNSVTSIGVWAFYNCKGFTGSLTIGNAVMSIGEWAFSNCSGFTGSLTIGNSVTSIGDWAFYNCNSFTSIEFGESLEKIGEKSGAVFSYCSKIESVTCHAVNPPVFYGSDNFSSSVFQNAYLYVPAESSGLYAVTDVWKDFVNRDEITTPVETVSKQFFVSLENTLDLTAYLPAIPDGYTVVSQYPDVAGVSANNVVEPKQYGQTNITYRKNGITYATFDIYVWPTLTLEHGDGAVSTHFVLHNTCPTVYLEPANGYDIGGVTHDGADVTDAVTAANGYYTFAEPITANTVINLAMYDNGTTGVGAVATDADGVRVLVDGRTVSVVGKAAGETVTLYDMSGSALVKTTDSVFDVERPGIFLVKVGDKTFKIITRF